VQQESGHQLRLPQVDHRRGKGEAGDGVEPQARQRRLAAADRQAAAGGAGEGMAEARQEVDPPAGAVPVTGRRTRLTDPQPLLDGDVEMRHEAAHHQAERFEADRRVFRPGVGGDQRGEAVQGAVDRRGLAARAQRADQHLGERHAQAHVQQDQAALGERRRGLAVEQVDQLPAGAQRPPDVLVAQAFQQERRVLRIAAAGRGDQRRQLAAATGRAPMRTEAHQVIGDELGGELPAAGGQLGAKGR